MRFGAVQGLGHLSDHRASEMLKSVLCDADEHDVTRIAAAKSLTQIEGEKVFPVIAKIVTDPTEPARVRFHTAVDLVEATNGAIDDMGVVTAVACWRYGRHPFSEAPNARAAVVAFEAILKGDSDEKVRSAANQHLPRARKRLAELKSYLPRR